MFWEREKDKEIFWQKLESDGKRRKERNRVKESN
jgi:hypothetical protein